MNAVLLLLVLLALPAGAQPAGRRGAEQPAAQLEALESEYRTLLDRLQEATRQRWQAREAQVAAKERHREQVDRMVREQERLYAEVARAREEHLAREQLFEREKELRNRARDEWRYVVDVIVARTEAHVGAASAGFPLGQDDRHRRLVALQDRFPARTHPARRLEGGVGLALDHLRTLTECALEQTTVVAPGNVPLTARVLRVGEVMAWALPADSPPLALLSVEGVQQYRWEEVTNPDVAAALPPLFTRSLSEGRLAGDVPFDVVRSDRTRSLIGGRRLSRAAQLYAFVQAGGIVLVPLGLIIVWALGIVCERTLLYLRRRRGGRRVLAQAPQMLDKGEHERARELVARLGGGCGRGGARCLPPACSRG